MARIRGFPSVLAALTVGALAVTGDLTVGGGAVVVGEMTSESTYETLNSDKVAGAPTEDMGFRARRGASPWWVVGWDETNDRTIIGTSTDGTVANTTGGAVWTGAHTIQASATVSQFAVSVTLNDRSASVNRRDWSIANAANSYGGLSLYVGAAVDVAPSILVVEFLATSITSAVPLLAPNGSGAAPSYSFSGDPDTGIYYAAANSVSISVGGTEAFRFSQASMLIYNTLAISWGNAGMGGLNTSLYGDSSGVLSQRNGTAAQEFRVYGTTTGPKYAYITHDGTSAYFNNVGGNAYFGAGSYFWGIENGSGVLFPAGTSGTKPIGFTSARVSTIFLGGNTPAASAPMIDCAQTWNDAGVTFVGAKVSVVTTLYAGGSRVVDVLTGAAGATSVFSIDAGGNVRASGALIGNDNIFAGQTAYITWSGRSYMTSPDDGVMLFTDNATTSFGRLCFGGATGSFGAIGRDGAGIKLIGGDGTTGIFLSGVEQTAPAAPAANGYRIYAEDNGAGKTRLMCLFGSGAAQQLAIEP